MQIITTELLICNFAEPENEIGITRKAKAADEAINRINGRRRDEEIKRKRRTNSENVQTKHVPSRQNKKPLRSEPNMARNGAIKRSYSEFPPHKSRKCPCGSRSQRRWRRRRRVLLR